MRFLWCNYWYQNSIFWVSVTIEPGRFLLQFVTTNCLICHAYTAILVSNSYMNESFWIKSNCGRWLWANSRLLLKTALYVSQLISAYLGFSMYLTAEVVNPFKLSNWYISWRNFLPKNWWHIIWSARQELSTAVEQKSTCLSSKVDFFAVG